MTLMRGSPEEIARDLDAIDAEIARLRRYKERIDWLHTGGSRDPEGYEWGVFRVRWSAQGQPESVLHTLTDLSDLDAEMMREAGVANYADLTPDHRPPVVQHARRAGG